MDLNLIRAGVTLVSLVAFLCIVVWAYRPSRKELQDMRAARILEDNEGDTRP